MSASSDTLFEASGPALPAHVYVHIPFCASKCSYCDFYSMTEYDSTLVEMLARGIECAFDRWALASLPGVVSTLYLGGGTPTVEPGLAARLIVSAREKLMLRDGAEITVEGNPDSLGAERVGELAAAGCTRISVGVQSFAARELALLGRRHDAASARDACERVVSSGMDLSVDLMCGIPGQTMASWTASLERAVDLGAKHLSVYPLSLEEDTPLAVACGSGLVAEPDPDAAAAMMLLAEEFLASRGVHRYEVANYAVPGHESRHNIAYWTGASYLGVGPAAHGMLDAATAVAVGLLDSAGAEDVARVRYWERPDLGAWLTDPRGESETLTADEVAREDLMLGLRLVKGVPKRSVTAAGLDVVVEDLVGDGLVELAGDGPDARVRTTSRGWLLGNEVFGRIWGG